MRGLLNQGALVLFPSAIVPATARILTSSKETVKAAKGTRPIFYTPLYTAIEKGFFQEEVVNVILPIVWDGDINDHFPLNEWMWYIRYFLFLVSIQAGVTTCNFPSILNSAIKKTNC
ncbi:hypothetical protein [Bacillus sp. FJAT-44742]|uniref:hypothetical protein n=1 Tax=Bacillus sp. FJAT-44742 TaxID=2014005 RepID=UPI000C246870|nr:hypothetical protein [Bacillus sp. FJAT-44742]